MATTDCERIKNNIKNLNSELRKNCRLIVVSKYRSIEEIQCAYNAEQVVFAENRVQALLERKELLPNDIEWHLIGHLQRNKVKYIASFIQMIHSIDSIKLLQEVDKRAKENDRKIACLLQVHIAQEESKFGIKPDNLAEIAQEIKSLDFKHVEIKGLMAMASNTDDILQINKEFKLSAELHQQLTSILPKASELSIGMSSDYLLAQNWESTMVRIGSKVFN